MLSPLANPPHTDVFEIGSSCVTLTRTLSSSGWPRTNFPALVTLSARITGACHMSPCLTGVELFTDLPLSGLCNIAACEVAIPAR